MALSTRFSLTFLLVLALSSTTLGQLTGTKTIPGNYATIALAVADLNTQGVGPGGVTFDVAAGYTETLSGPITLTATGTAANPIVFQKNGSGANPLITAYVGTQTPGSATHDDVWRLVGADYVTIDGIDLTDPNTTNPESMEGGYVLYKASASDGAQNNTIRNCVITLNRVNNATGGGPSVEGSRGIEATNATPSAATTAITPTDPAGANSNNRFYANTIQNCNYGIMLSGYAAPSPFTLGDTGNDVGGSSGATGNTILNFGGGAATNPAAGVRANNQWGVNISYNTINNNNGSGVNHATTLRGIYAQAGTSANATISNNTITIHGGGTTTQVSAIENAIGSTAAGNTVDISNNNVTGDYLTATTGTFYPIYNTASAATVNIVNNLVHDLSYSNSTAAGSGAFYCIYNTGAATTVNIRGNSIGNVGRTGTTGGTTIGIYASSGSNQTVKLNTVNNLSIDGTGATSTMYGIQTSTGVIVVDSNIVSNLTCIKASGTGALYGIYNIASPTNENYNYNQVYNITHNGTGTAYGIYTFTTTGARTVSGNLVRSVSTAGTLVAGINQSSSSPTIFKNRIYDIRSTASGAPTVQGIGVTSVGTAGSASIYNNLIGDLQAPNATTSAATAPSVRGINITATTANSTFNISYNTVHLNCSSTSSNFGTTALFVTTSATATSGALTLRNNIFVNLSTPAGTGLAVAYQRSSAALDNYASESNNNLFYAGSPGVSKLIFYDGTNSDQTLAAFISRVTPREASSVTENPPFLSTAGADATFLHLNPANSSQVDGGGQPITGITDDYDGDLRDATTPDIGADEYISTPAGHDLRMAAIILPPLPVRAGDAVQFHAVVENLSSTATEVSYSVNWGVDGTPGTPVIGGPIAPGATDTIPLQWTALFGQHTVVASVSTPADTNYINDTTQVSIGVYGPLFATSADSLLGAANTGARDSALFYVRNIQAINSNFAASAVMYSETAGPTAAPIRIPVMTEHVPLDGTNGALDNQFHVVPPAFTNTNGGVTFLGPLANAQRTYLLLIHEDQLSAIAGQYLTGITWRLPASASSAWPTADATITSFDVYLGQSVTPAAVSNTIADNYVGPRTQVRSGGLTIPASSFPFGGNPNAFGMTIPFDVPWQYTGGNLIVELRHTGFTSSTSNDAVTTSNPDYGTKFITRWVADYAATTASSQGNFTVTRLELSSGVWMTVNPTSGTIVVGDSVLMKARFDASIPAVTPGTYHGHIELKATNTPLADTLRVPARFTVQLNPNAVLQVAPDSLNFGRIAVGASKTLSVLVRNLGGTTLVVSNITQSDPNFSANPTSFSLAYNDTQRVNVTFTGPLPGDTTHRGTMTFVSNAIPGGQQVKLVGETTGLPLAGDYTVGLTLFNQVTGRNLSVERRRRTVELEIEIPVERQVADPARPSDRKDRSLVDPTIAGVDQSEESNEVPSESVLERRVISVEEEYGVLVDETGSPYTGELYAELSNGRMDNPLGIYPTITAAVAALNERGLSGPVRFLLVDATYPSETYPITLGAVTGMSSANTVTFKPQVGVAPVIEGSAANMFTIDGGSHYVFDGSNATGGTTRDMTLRNTNSSGVLIRLQNGAVNNVFKNCKIEASNTSTTSGSVLVGTAASAPEGNSLNTFTNNLFTNAAGATYSNAIYSSGTAANPNSAITVNGNEFVNFTGTGVRGTTATGGNWIVTNNHFYNNASTPPSTTQAGININPGVISSGNQISGNFIGGSEPNAGGSPWTNTGAVAVAGIIAGVDTVVESTIQNNVIRNFNLTSTGAASFVGISLTTGRATISGNTIGHDSGPNNIVVAGSSTTHGISVTAASANQPTKILNNLISGLSANGTGTGVRVRGINFTGAAQSNIKGNMIHSLSSAGSQVGLTAGNQVAVGLHFFPGSTFYQTDISNNTIYDIVATNTGNLGSIATGMTLTNIAGSASSNRIYDIRNMSTGTSTTVPPIASGMYLRFLSQTAIFNNMISIGSDQSTNTQFNGVFLVTGTAGNVLGLIYNSINVGGAATSGSHSSHAFMRGDNAGTVGINTTVLLRNNILSNTRSGGGTHFAIANQLANDTGWNTAASNYNLLHGNPSTIGQWGPGTLTFSGWRTASGGDSASVTGDPLFVNATDLHITNAGSPASHSGTPIDGITTDFDGDPRNPSTPDIGADEFMAAPNVAGIVSPDNGAVDVPITVTLNWSAPVGGGPVTGYKLFFGTDGGGITPPTNIVAGTNLGNVLTYDPTPDLEHGTVHYWQVVPTGSGGDAVGCPIWSFTTIAGVATINVALTSGWNMIANPVNRDAGTDSVRELYPTSSFAHAFKYTPGVGYEQEFRMANKRGYWGKFPGAGSASITGGARTLDTIPVVSGWNMVGSISSNVDTSTITSSPAGIRQSNWFGYNGGYSASAQIVPGKAYWVKASQAGSFYFQGGAMHMSKATPADETPAARYNELTITDAEGNSQTLFFCADAANEIDLSWYQMPPAPPQGVFDARFESVDGGQLLETYPAQLDQAREFSVKVQTVAYPLTVRWKILGTDTREFTLSDAVGGRALAARTIEGEGSLQVDNHAITRLTLKVDGGNGVPTEYALYQNYPNPFNPTTSIKLALPIDGEISVAIYNVLGQKVRSLLNEERKAGYHTVQWNGTDDNGVQVTSGVYFVRFAAHGAAGAAFSDVKKLMLVK
jgi:hypothetical protein